MRFVISLPKYWLLVVAVVVVWIWVAVAVVVVFYITALIVLTILLLPFRFVWAKEEAALLLQVPMVSQEDMPIRSMLPRVQAHNLVH